MKAYSLPLEIVELVSSGKPPGEVLEGVLPIVGKVLDVDRVFLYLRNPELALGKIVFCWRHNSTIPDATEPEWKNDTKTLPLEDPLFAAGLRTDPSVYVPDVETADPSVLNRDFEAKTFGHRALIHAHIVSEGKLWGILQPCTFDKPKYWSESDRAFIEAILPRLAPFAKEYMLRSIVNL